VLGRYFAEVTAVVLGLALFAAYVTAGALIRRLRPGTLEWLSRPAADLSRSQARGRGAHTEPSKGARVPWAPLLLAAVFLGWAAYFAIEGWTAGPLTAVRPDQVASGQALPSRWVEVSGQLLLDAHVAFGKSGTSPDLFVPLVSPQWQPGEPVALYVKTTEHRVGDIEASGKATGIVAWGGLPGPVKVAFEEAGLAPADRYRVLDAQTDPARERVKAAFGATVGGVALIIACVVWAVRRRRAGLAGQTVRGER
jgi:hypothetical protein